MKRIDLRQHRTIECPITCSLIQHLLFFCFQAEKFRNELESLRKKYHSANEEISNLRLALEESRANSERLHRESELVVQNVNVWVREQK